MPVTYFYRMLFFMRNIKGQYAPDGDTCEKFKKKNYFRLNETTESLKMEIRFDNKL